MSLHETVSGLFKIETGLEVYQRRIIQFHNIDTPFVKKKKKKMTIERKIELDTETR